MDKPMEEVQSLSDTTPKTQPMTEDLLQTPKREENPVLHAPSIDECSDGGSSQVYVADEIHLYGNEEPSAVDLRTTKSTNNTQSPNQLLQNKEPSSIAQLLENFYCPDSCANENSVINETLEETKSAVKSDCTLADYIDYESNCDSVVAIDCSTQEHNYYDGSYLGRSTVENIKPLWSTVASGEPSTLVDQGSQTQEKETKDASVQTYLEPKILSYSYLRNTKEGNVKFTCTICQRVYITKTNYDRHLRTHIKTVHANRKTFKNIRFTTEAKLQVTSKHVNRAHRPIIIQMPRVSNFQCDFCKKLYLSQAERDSHDCIIVPFPMTQCPECHVKFYTHGALNDHIRIVHKTENQINNAYYCIFCDEHFDGGYNFHLHLDKHLSP